MPNPLCTVSDVLRKFDPRLTRSDLSSGDYIGNHDVAQVRARIDAVSDEWDQADVPAMRLRRTGAPDAPRTWDHHDADRSGSFPLVVDLDHEHIAPIDSNAGDALEVRTGRDSWDDVTDEEGDEWVLLHDTGKLKVFRFLVRRVWWEAPDERYLRATYRYGNLGGDRDRGGETTLASSATDADTTLDVADASRLPPDGGVMLVGGGDGEYVRVTDIDTAADTLTVTRGVQATSKSPHSSGATVHFCPESVRDAVAARAAAELVRYDGWIGQVDESQEGVTAQQKIDRWDQQWTQAIDRHARVRSI